MSKASSEPLSNRSDARAHPGAAAGGPLVNSPVYRWLAWLALAGILISVVTGNGRDGHFSVPTFALGALAVLVLLHNRLPALFQFMVTGAAVLGTAGWKWGLYERLVFYDELTHAFTLMAMTLVGAYYLYGPLFEVIAHRTWLISLCLLTFGVALGALWEVVEFFFVLPRGTMTMHDTTTDLIVDGIGSLAAIPMALRTMRAGRKRPG